jgi:hypothetical protein
VKNLKKLGLGLLGGVCAVGALSTIGIIPVKIANLESPEKAHAIYSRVFSYLPAGPYSQGTADSYCRNYVQSTYQYDAGLGVGGYNSPLGWRTPKVALNYVWAHLNNRQCITNLYF